MSNCTVRRDIGVWVHHSFPKTRRVGEVTLCKFTSYV